MKKKHRKDTLKIIFMPFYFSFRIAYFFLKKKAEKIYNSLNFRWRMSGTIVSRTYVYVFPSLKEKMALNSIHTQSNNNTLRTLDTQNMMMMLSCYFFVTIGIIFSFILLFSLLHSSSNNSNSSIVSIYFYT